MKKRFLTVSLLITSAFFMFSCNLARVLFPTDDAARKPVEQTVDARLTELAFETLAAGAVDPSLTPSTPTPQETASSPAVQTATPVVQASATQQSCDRLSFVRDVTIPDGARLYTDTLFTKVWRIKNAGSCTWSSDYALVFRQGDSMGADLSIPLGTSLRPGEMMNVSVSMKAPSTPGEYSSRWMMRNQQGELFGTGNSADGYIWTSVTVVNYKGEMDEAYPRDFARNIGAARWESNAGVLSPDSGEDFRLGSVYALDNPTFEGGHQDDELALVMIPSEGSDGLISGRYPPIEIHDGDHFHAIIGCLEDSNGCYARVVLNYRLASGQTKTLDSWFEEYDGDTTQLDVDLSSLKGEDIQLILQVQNLGNNQDDRIFWLAPEIVNTH